MEKINPENLEKQEKQKGITRREFLKKIISVLLLVLSLKGTESKSKSSPETKIGLGDLRLSERELEKLYEDGETILRETPTLTPKPTPTKTPTKTPTVTATPTPTPEFGIETKEQKITTKVIYRGPRGTKKVAITFDDTPSPQIIEELVNFAKENQIPMVFFVIGRTTTPIAAEIIKTGIESGFIRIGNHSFNHNINAFSSLNPEYIHQEKEMWINKMKELGFNENLLRTYFRPPGGAGGYRGGNQTLLSVLSKNEYKYLCMWDVEFIYTTRVNNLPYNVRTLTQIVLNGVRGTQGGNLVLAHFNPVDSQAIKEAILQLKNEGYEFVFPEGLFD
ncbi:MAG: hypothetical protein C4348_01075 [Patescibacteria group bacterium]